jgi:hypothetical protein
MVAVGSWGYIRRYWQLWPENRSGAFCISGIATVIIFFMGSSGYDKDLDKVKQQIKRPNMQNLRIDENADGS